MTIVMCALFGLVYVAEVMADGGALWHISVPTLKGLGGNVPELTFGDQQCWRLVTAALLHAGILHIGFNSYAMYIIGTAIERTLGAGWMVGCFVFSGITGSLLSGYANPPKVVAIGASGGIFGLVAMAAVTAYLAPRLTGFARKVLVQWLVFALAIGVVGGFDNWGHVGGIVGGAVCGLVVAMLKKKPQQVRQFGRVMGVLGAVVIAGSLLKAVQFVLMVG